jgi:hypothetical protein
VQQVQGDGIMKDQLLQLLHAIIGGGTHQHALAAARDLDASTNIGDGTHQHALAATRKLHAGTDIGGGTHQHARQLRGSCIQALTLVVALISMHWQLRGTWMQALICPQPSDTTAGNMPEA